MQLAEQIRVGSVSFGGAKSEAVADTIEFRANLNDGEIEIEPK